MGLLPRAPPPAPLNTTTAAASSQTTTASPTTYENVCHASLTNKPLLQTDIQYQTIRSAGTEASEASSFAPTYSRQDTSSTTTSRGTQISRNSMSGPSRRATAPVVNRYTHCGRHSDQYLFGGWGDLVKGVFSKKHERPQKSSLGWRQR